MIMNDVEKIINDVVEQIESKLQIKEFFFSSRRRHTRWPRDWSSDVCSSDLDNQVLIDMRATSINPIDWKIRAGYMKDGMDFDFLLILGWDAVGVVIEIGKIVT